MDNSKLVFLINTQVRAVSVDYDPDRVGAKPTVYKTMDPDLAVGDMVVVQSGTRWKMTTAKVVEVDLDMDFDSGVKIEWIVTRIDQEVFNRVLAQEAEAVSTFRRVELKKKRDALRADMFADHEETIAKLALASPSPIEGG